MPAVRQKLHLSICSNLRVQLSGASDDKTFLQDIGDEKVAFSRRIDAISKKSLKYNYDPSQAKAPKNVDHDALRDAYLEKASSILYCSNNKWVELGGDD